jgi:hypothetical protein
VIFTEEQYEVVGDPTPLLVAESVWLVMDRMGRGFARLPEVEDEVVGYGCTPTEAKERIQAAIAAGDVNVRLSERGRSTLTLDPLVSLRMERRLWFWNTTEQGQMIAAHFTNECAIVRASVAEWNDGYAEPPGTADLLATIRHLSGYREGDAALHIILNAVDAGAVRAEPEYPGSPDLRFYNVEGWTE